MIRSSADNEAPHDVTTHTPGPWYVERKYDGGCTVAFMRDFVNDGHNVALAVHGPEAWIHRKGSVDWIAGNANLIAAAPELLYELKASQDALCHAWCRRDINDHTEYCKNALAAIAKAEGR